MFPDIAQLEFKQSDPAQPIDLGKSFKFDFTAGDFILSDGKLVAIKDIEAIKVWVHKILMTEKFKFQIYKRTDGDEYGVTLEDLIGTILPRSFVEAELKREIKEAVTRHPRIASISNLTIERDGNLLKISFKINLTDGQGFGQEVAISG